MTNSTPSLNNLHDIILPEPASWWPPAPGWWIICTIVISALIFIVIRSLRTYSANAYRRAGLLLLNDIEKRLNSIPSNIAVKEVSTVLKRVAIAAYGREAVAALHGKEWLEFLTNTAPLCQFTKDFEEILCNSIYTDNCEFTDSDYTSFFNLCRKWIKEHSIKTIH